MSAARHALVGALATIAACSTIEPAPIKPPAPVAVPVDLPTEKRGGYDPSKQTHWQIAAVAGGCEAFDFDHKPVFVSEPYNCANLGDLKPPQRLVMLGDDCYIDVCGGGGIGAVLTRCDPPASPSLPCPTTLDDNRCSGNPLAPGCQ
jgi:hypothetical protein